MIATRSNGLHFPMAMALAVSLSSVAENKKQTTNHYRVVKETGNLVSNFKLAQIKASAYNDAYGICDRMAGDLVIVQEIPTPEYANNGRAQYELIYKCVESQPGLVDSKDYCLVSANFDTE